ncbi:MAG TPA: DUF4126 domain-containing protein [Anaerolineales bacterium]|nr:DUF4126 domain-containing protein [Anaerolineales bacterium]HRQ92431.1 DUF4126 domain-containing protein [Anaerolineales bacterium]
MDVLSGIFSAFGLSASAGLNAYIPLLVVSLLGRYTSLIELNSPWDTLTNGWIIGLLVALSAIEFFADKTPLVNHLNDAIQTFVRPAAGAIAFAASTQVIDGINPVVALAAGLLIAGTVHVAKAGVMRPAVTGVSGGTANVAVGLVEDVAAITISVFAVLIPLIIGIVFIPLLALVIWLLWRRANRNVAQQTN